MQTIWRQFTRDENYFRTTQSSEVIKTIAHLASRPSLTT